MTGYLEFIRPTCLSAMTRHRRPELRDRKRQYCWSDDLSGTSRTTSIQKRKRRSSTIKYRRTKLGRSERCRSKLGRRRCQSELRDGKRHRKRRQWAGTLMTSTIRAERAYADRPGSICVRKTQSQDVRNNIHCLTIEDRKSELIDWRQMWCRFDPSWWITIIGLGPAPIAIRQCLLFREMIGLCPSRSRKFELQHWCDRADYEYKPSWMPMPGREIGPFIKRNWTPFQNTTVFDKYLDRLNKDHERDDSVIIVATKG